MANQGASSSSAPFTNSWKYHVFLSFRGFDTRSNFTSHLYSALRREGINTFMDDDELRRGEEISNALLTAIEDSKIYVVVFSENYASSKWCLDELVKILDCKESNQQLVIPVFHKVNPSDVRNHRGSFGDALANMDCNNVEKVNRWKEALSQAGKLAGFTLSEGHRSEAELIHKVVQHISREVIDRTYLHLTEYPVGMHHPVEDITKLLALREEEDVRMVGVWGTGGIGKTTIATAVYNSIAHEFEGCSFLANVKECSTWQGGGLAKLQRTLLYEILRDTNLEVANVHKGATMIKQRLSCRKVLLVLDDVDDMEQLHKLVGACEWFGAGSRIIITTRDKQLLTAHDVNLIHEVKILDDPEALELFCWHAFKTSGPPLGDYVKLAERAIRYAQGLPLALKVLGSCLCGGDIDKWKATLEGFKSPNIQDVLKISYNALDHGVQEVFLDIACFFKGKSRKRVIEILVACDPNASYRIEVLKEKALVSVEGDHIQMHDLLEEMGKDIVYLQSPTEAGGRSRLWSYEDIEHVLASNTGTNQITRIVLNFPNRDDVIHFMLNFPNSDDEICLNADSFSKMKNLKIFIIYNVCLSGGVHYLPNSLRVIDWHGCPFQSFPPKFRPKELVVLNMPRNRIKQLGEGLKHLTKLTSLNFEGSQFLIEIPDLSSSPNLRYLNANGCTSLVEVHPSVGYLDKLENLDFCGCHKLTQFPNKVRLKSLIFFRLYDCIKLENFPEIVDKMESLNYLDLGRTAIKELPSSVGNLTALKVLELGGSAIEELPSSTGNLTALEILSLEGCENLANLPQRIYGLHLESINLNRCPKLVILPNNLISEALSSAELPLEVRTNANSPRNGNLVRLGMMDFEECNVSNVEYLEKFCCWSNLMNINLSKSNFVILPVCISKCVNLRELDLSGCKKLVEILGQLPASIARIDMADCISLKRFSTLSKILEDGDMQHISYVDLSNCHRLGLDVSKMAKSVLNEMRRSKRFIVKLPGSGSEVPEWFTFRNYFDEVIFNDQVKDVGDDYDESKTHYELPIEIHWTSGLEKTKLVLCAVWEITESFVSPCSLVFSVLNGGRLLCHRDEMYVFGGETGAGGNVWLECIPFLLDDQLKPPIFRVTVSGQGLLIKSIGADLTHISMSKDDGDDGKHNDENELDDDGDVGVEIRPRKRTKI
ncbi:TMV resistance protein N-like [Prunus avium]|uniref:TMV resistance protein N-like n=1 Tax=Prunus avium TaxID=42229 RepID=A0A6P5TRN1_PRUAV|nr:TMV resistance protein N-like [Prunus avium]XP_021829802.1 TMV resistance protein N-like [Prunus avium]